MSSADEIVENSKGWYCFEGVEQLDSPALVIYKERVAQNIQKLVGLVGNTDRLRPHVKTCKAAEPITMMMQAGVSKFKCATIAEAEMLAIAGATDVLIAYQFTGPKLSRLVKLMREYPQTDFSVLIDNCNSATELNVAMQDAQLYVDVYIDLNVGMNRTGIPILDDVIGLYKLVCSLQCITVKGLHAYDGHIGHGDINTRSGQCADGIDALNALVVSLQGLGFNPIVIAGGSPTLPVYAQLGEVECSPGTFIYWDHGYGMNLQGDLFIPAAVMLTRVVSLPAPGIICIDLGHKAIASESPLEKRAFFINAPELKVVGHSEEHMVLEAGDHHDYKVGDVLYAIPYHICPTVALHAFATVVSSGTVANRWYAVARNRYIHL